MPWKVTGMFKCWWHRPASEIQDLILTHFLLLIPKIVPVLHFLTKYDAFHSIFAFLKTSVSWRRLVFSLKQQKSITNIFERTVCSLHSPFLHAWFFLHLMLIARLELKPGTENKKQTCNICECFTASKQCQKYRFCGEKSLYL